MNQSLHLFGLIYTPLLLWRWLPYTVWRDLPQTALITPVLLDAASVFLALISSLGRGAAGDVCFSNRWFFRLCSESFCVCLRLSPHLPEPFWTFELLRYDFVCLCLFVYVWRKKGQTERTERKEGELLLVHFCCVFWLYTCAPECVCMRVSPLPLGWQAVVQPSDRQFH